MHALLLVSVRTEGTSNAKSVMLEPSIAPMAARPPVVIPTHADRTGADASDRAAFVSDDARACRHATRGELHIRVALAARARRRGRPRRWTWKLTTARRSW